MNLPTPQQLRERFGTNLRVLLKDAVSVSQVCRDIGVNRTQFIRYLSGEAHPRPDVLFKICQYFKVDARILLEPVEDIRSPDPFHLGLADDGVTELVPASQRQIPDGTYISWGYGTLWPGCVFRNPVSVFTRDGVRRTRTRIPAWVLGWSGLNQDQTFHDFRAILVRQNEGVLMIERNSGSDILMLYEFRRGVVHNDRFFHGIYMIGTTPIVDIPHAVAPMLLERLPSGYRAIRSVLKIGDAIMAEEDAPGPVRAALAEIARTTFMTPNHAFWGRSVEALKARLRQRART